jgi:hypothetical protein
VTHPPANGHLAEPHLQVLPHERKHRFWTTREEKVLRDHYPTGGAAACLPHLPGRTFGAIYQHADAMGLAAPGNEFKRQRWATSATIDNVIRRYWLAPVRGYQGACAAAVGRPPWWVSQRARKLGLLSPRFKEPAWTEEELELAAANGHRSLAFIQRILARHGFKRSETAIQVRLKRLGPGSRKDPDHFTASELARLMGVDPTTVGGWIRKGMLKARRRGTERTDLQGGDMHWVHRRDLRAFIRDNAAAVDLRKVDRFWFIDLAFDKCAPRREPAQ